MDRFIDMGVDVLNPLEPGPNGDIVMSELVEKYKTFSKETVDAVIEKEVGDVFVKVLEHAGVYKRTAEGKAAFLKFVEKVNQ